MAEKTIAGLQPRRLSDDEPIDYVPREHVVTGRAVVSRERPVAVPALERSAAETLAAELVVFAARAAGAGATGNPLELALLRAARVLVDELGLLISGAVEPTEAERGGESPRTRRKKGQ